LNFFKRAYLAYACAPWTIKKTDKDKILAFEMYCTEEESELENEGHK